MQLEFITHPASSDSFTATVVALHGIDANKDALYPLALQIKIPSVRWILPTAPFISDKSVHIRRWFNADQFDMNDVVLSRKSLLNLFQMERQNGIPSSKVFLLGFSQGGAMSLDFALRYPFQIGGVIMLSAFFIEPTLLTMERSLANAAVPIFIGHGIHDHEIPIEQSRQQADFLTDLGYTVEYHEYETGHHICLPEIKDVRSFIESHL